MPLQHIKRIKLIYNYIKLRPVNENRDARDPSLFPTFQNTDPNNKL